MGSGVASLARSCEGPGMAKDRTDIPPEIAGHVLFLSDRTCCVCRDGNKGPQIHHIDGDPTNHDPENLAVLCREDHGATLVTGGFVRKLDAHQIVLYRDRWLADVERMRAESPQRPRPTLNVVRAVWGGEENKRDVTGIVRGLILDESLFFVVHRNVLGDPDRGNPKKRLVIEYQVDLGRLIPASFAEYETVDLP
jgi:hypothetical protein